MGTSEKPDIQASTCLDKGFQGQATAATSEEFIHEEAKDRHPTEFQTRVSSEGSLLHSIPYIQLVVP